MKKCTAISVLAETEQEKWTLYMKTCMYIHVHLKHNLLKNASSKRHR